MRFGKLMLGLVVVAGAALAECESAGAYFGGSMYGGWGWGVPVQGYYYDDCGSASSYNVPVYESKGGVRSGQQEVDPIPEPAGAIKTPMLFKVPSDADVSIGEYNTRSRGEIRRFNTRFPKGTGLHKYKITVSLRKNGKQVSTIQYLTIYPGRTNIYGFYYDERLEQLVLFRNQDSQLIAIFSVPEDAELTLYGKKTNSTGKLRYFYTSLANGKGFDDYPVEVTVNRDERKLEWTDRVTLTAGKLHRFHFEVDTADEKLVRVESPARSSNEPRTKLASTANGK